MTESAPTVGGVVIVGSDLPSFSGASVHIRIENVSHVDAPALVVAQQTVLNVSHQAGRCDVVRIDSGLVAQFDARAAYTVRAHVSMGGGGGSTQRIARGDLLSMESYPVLTLGNPDWIAVRVREVK